MFGQSDLFNVVVGERRYIKIFERRRQVHLRQTVLHKSIHTDILHTFGNDDVLQSATGERVRAYHLHTARNIDAVGQLAVTEGAAFNHLDAIRQDKPLKRTFVVGKSDRSDGVNTCREHYL